MELQNIGDGCWIAGQPDPPPAHREHIDTSDIERQLNELRESEIRQIRRRIGRIEESHREAKLRDLHARAARMGRTSRSTQLRRRQRAEGPAVLHYGQPQRFTNV